MSNIDEALRLADEGIPVFPVEPSGKRPLISDWPNRATTDPDQISEWFSQDPEPNIAAPAGPESGFVVVDVDIPGGRDTIAELLEEAGEDTLDSSVEVRTPSGGMHYFFRYEEGLTKTTLGRSVDFQGEGSYVLLSPSDNGVGSYEYIRGRLGDTLLPGLPDYLRPKTTETEDPETISERRGRAAGVLAPLFGGEANGHRHKLHLFLAGGLANAGWTQGDAVAFCRRVAEESGDEEVDDRLRAVRDTLERRNDMEPIAGFPSLVEELSQIYDKDTANEAVDEVREILRLWGGSPTQQDGLHLLHENFDGLGDVTFPISTWDDIDPRDAPEQEFIVDDLLPLRGSHFILAPPKTGKSQTIAHIEACLLAGEPVFGDLGVKEDARILHIQLEEQAHAPRERVEMALRGLGWDEEDILEHREEFTHRFVPSVMTMEYDPDSDIDRQFQADKHYNELITLAEKGHFDLVVLDPLRAAHMRDENSSTDMLVVTKLMRAMGATDCCFLIAHHTPKASDDEDKKIGGAALRGSGDLDAARDDLIQLIDGKFGKDLILGRFSRNDSDSFMGVSSRVEEDAAEWSLISRADQMAGWEAVKGDLKLLEKLRRGQQLKKSACQQFYDRNYAERVVELARKGVVRIEQGPANGGRPPEYVMMPDATLDEDAGKTKVPTDSTR